MKTLVSLNRKIYNNNNDNNKSVLIFFLLLLIVIFITTDAFLLSLTPFENHYHYHHHDNIISSSSGCNNNKLQIRRYRLNQYNNNYNNNNNNRKNRSNKMNKLYFNLVEDEIELQTEDILKMNDDDSNNNVMNIPIQNQVDNIFSGRNRFDNDNDMMMKSSRRRKKKMNLENLDILEASFQALIKDLEKTGGNSESYLSVMRKMDMEEKRENKKFFEYHLSENLKSSDTEEKLLQDITKNMNIDQKLNSNDDDDDDDDINVNMNNNDDDDNSSGKLVLDLESYDLGPAMILWGDLYANYIEKMKNIDDEEKELIIETIKRKRMIREKKENQFIEYHYSSLRKERYRQCYLKQMELRDLIRERIQDFLSTDEQNDGIMAHLFIDSGNNKDNDQNLESKFVKEMLDVSGLQYSILDVNRDSILKDEVKNLLNYPIFPQLKFNGKWYKGGPCGDIRKLYFSSDFYDIVSKYWEIKLKENDKPHLIPKFYRRKLRDKSNASAALR